MPTNRRSVAEKHRLAKYGLTPQAYTQMLHAQGGKCAICDEAESVVQGAGNNELRALAVDHDHDTGDVRALLCTRCNAALGFLRDDPQIALAAASYLLAHKGT